MAIKPWTQLEDNELVAHAEVRNAVAIGVLEWINGEPTLPNDGSGLNPDNRCYTREDFQLYVRHQDMGGSGISMDEYMTKEDMINYRMLTSDLDPPLITAQAESSSSIRIHMDAQGIDGYLLEYRVGSTNTWTEIPPIWAYGSTNYLHTNIPEATWVHYRARVFRQTSWGTAYSPYSAETSARTQTASPGNAPTGASLVIGINTIHDPATWSVSFTWNDNSNNETGFEVQRRINGGSYTLVATQPANSTSYYTTGLQELTLYQYRVRAIRNVNGQTSTTGWSTSPSVRSRPSAPSGLHGAAQGSTQAVLAWQNTSHASQVRIYRGGSLLLTFSRSGTHQERTVAASPGTTNNYEVRAYDSSSGLESPGATVSVVTPVTEPGAVSASDTSWCSGSTVTRRATITWTPGTTASGWNTEVHRYDGIGYTLIATIPASTSTYRDIFPGSAPSPLHYRVRHVRSGSPSSGYATSNTLTSLGSDACPGTPGISTTDNTSCSGGSTSGHIRVAWSGRSGWSVRLQRRVNGGSYSTIGTYTSGTTSYQDSNVSAGNSYQYRTRYQRTVDGTTSTGSHSTSSEVNVIEKCQPNLTSATASLLDLQICPTIDETHQVNWSYSTTAGADSHHIEIYRSINGGNYVRVATNIPIQTQSRTLSLNYGQCPGFLGNWNDTFIYQVRVVNTSSGSTVSSVTTSPFEVLHSDCSSCL